MDNENIKLLTFYCYKLFVFILDFEEMNVLILQ